MDSLILPTPTNEELIRVVGQAMLDFAAKINRTLTLQNDIQRIAVFHDPACSAVAKGLHDLLVKEQSLNVVPFGDLEFVYPRFPNDDISPVVTGHLSLLNDSRLHSIVIINVGGREDRFTDTRWLLRKLRSMARGTVNVVVAYGGLLTKDRLDKPGEIATGAEMIRDLGQEIGDRGRLFVVDPHSVQTTVVCRHGQEGVISTVQPIVQRMIEITGMSDCVNGIGVGFPDGGSLSRFLPGILKQLRGSPFWACNKQRDASGIRSTLHIDAAELEAISWLLIFDDIMRSGSTLLKCAQLFIAQGFPADRIVVAVVHYDPVDDPCEKLMAIGIRHIIVSDSASDAVDKALAAGLPLNVVPIAPVIAEAISGAFCSPR